MKNIIDICKAQGIEVPEDKVKDFEKAVLENYWSENCETVEIPMDKRLTPAQNAQVYYKKYNKSKAAKVHLAAQSEAAEEELVYVYSVLDALSRADGEKELSEIRQMAGGDSFNLGGIHIDIFDLPGHTRGSVVMLIREERVLLLGDACNYLTFLHEPYSTTVTEYKRNLEMLKPQVEGKYDAVYLSHGPGGGDVGLIDGVIKVCQDIMDGNTDDVPFGFKDSRGFLAKAEIERDVRVDGGIGNVIYSKERIF